MNATGVRLTLAGALLVSTLACGDGSTGPSDSSQDVMVVSLDGVGTEDAGIVLRLTGAIDGLEPARESLEVGWAHDPKNFTTVVILGRLSEGSDVLVVRRGSGLLPLRAELVEVAASDGGVSSPSSVLATVRQQ